MWCGPLRIQRYAHFRLLLSLFCALCVLLSPGLPAALAATHDKQIGILNGYGFLEAFLWDEVGETLTLLLSFEYIFTDALCEIIGIDLLPVPKEYGVEELLIICLSLHHLRISQ